MSGVPLLACKEIVPGGVAALLAGFPKRDGLRQAVPRCKSSVFKHSCKQWHTQGFIRFQVE